MGSERAAIDRDYAGFWRRLAAHLVDLALLGALVAAASRLGLVGTSFTTGGGDATLSITGWLPIGLSAAYVLGFWATRQATPGKLLMGLRIVDARTGGRPTFWQLLGRYLGYAVSAWFLLLGFLWIAFDARKQGWHDKLAGTLVVRAPREAAVGMGTLSEA